MAFDHLPTPDFLNVLAKGRLADRLQRAVRLWVMLHRLYGPKNGAGQLPSPFRYGDFRDLLFASTHGRSESAKVATLTAQCGSDCCCQQILTSWLLESGPAFSLADWQQEVMELSDVSRDALEATLESRPFATVHRSIRDDLAYLVELGWLTLAGKGRFCPVEPDGWPLAGPLTPLGNLSVAQTWEVWRSLKSISFVKPNLSVIVESLWEQLTHREGGAIAEPEQRIFLDLDYILSEEMQEQVDTLQEQIEQLWRSGSGIIQFGYGYGADSNPVPITVYPVCLHYSRRAKYLSAYGKDPKGVFGWHNYRLDRIVSSRLTILAWGDPQVSESLRKLWRTGQLPTSADVKTAIEDAWGFNFYLPRRLLIMRFPPEFAQRYVEQTNRHTTFEAVDYSALSTLVKQEIGEPDQGAVLDILARRNPQDAYYRAWIRLGDINIVMRLRDWRPMGEVIAPLALRQRMRQEADAELRHYGD